MMAGPDPFPQEESPSQQIDANLEKAGDWRGEKLARLRVLIQEADPDVVEEVKWKKPSNPMGVPVWSHAGIICIADTLKKAVRLTFPKGAQLEDPQKLFNTRLDSNTVRAIDFHEGSPVEEAALKALILEAVSSNYSQEDFQAVASGQSGLSGLAKTWAEFAQELSASGVLISNSGLAPIANATTVRVRKNQTLITDGPFAACWL
jgi:hypothetical protein